MKKQLLIVSALLFVTFGIRAQTLVKVTRTNEYNYSLIEEYYVLKSDKNIKQGPYIFKAKDNSRIITTGSYKNNLKDSLWAYFTSGGDTTSKGSYSEDKKIGVWTYFEHGKPENKYDYNTKALVYHRPNASDSIGYYVATTHDTTVTKLARAPIPLGGFNYISNQIARNIRFPADARESGNSGRVMVLFTITETGDIINCHVQRPRIASLDQEAVRCFEENHGQWAPGILDGKPVAVIEAMPVNFGKPVIINQ